MAKKGTKKIFTDPFIKLFGSPIRVRFLRLFLFNPKRLFTKEDIVSRTQCSSVDANRELSMFSDIGLIRKVNGKVVRFTLHDDFPYIEPLQQMLLSAPLRAQDLFERVKKTGVIKLIVLAGIFITDFDGRLDVLLVGDRISERRLKSVMKDLEADIGREIRFASFVTQDFLYRLSISDKFLRDMFDYPHTIIFDKLDIGLR